MRKLIKSTIPLINKTSAFYKFCNKYAKNIDELIMIFVLTFIRNNYETKLSESIIWMGGIPIPE